MVTRQAKRDMTRLLIDKYSVSERRACRVLDFPLATFRYKCHPRDDSKLIETIKQLIVDRYSYGFPRIHYELRKQGFQDNHKRIARIYYDVLKLAKNKRVKRKVKSCHARCEPSRASCPHEIVAMDFVSDEVRTGARRIRGLTVIDTHSRYCYAIEMDTSITGERVVRVLDRIFSQHGFPRMITVDNGPEFTSKAMSKWAYKNNVKLSFSRPGTPTDNPFIESFNGRFRDECLNAHWFLDLKDAREKIETWRVEYNVNRPHSSLGMMSPQSFLDNYRKESASGLIL